MRVAAACILYIMFPYCSIRGQQISHVLEGVRINAEFLKRMATSPLADQNFWSQLDI